MSTPTLAPLVAGERLDQAEFHARYEAMPPGIRAELIDGVVFMPPPAGEDHAFSWSIVIAWLSNYAARTPGVKPMTGPTIKLGRRNEPEPDGALIIRPEYGGQSRSEGGYVTRAPELLAEVARTTQATDLGPKLKSYRAAGVLEYLVRASDPDRVIWHARRRRGRPMPVRPPDADGIHRSAVFPGLWLDAGAMLADDLAGVLATLERGLATPGHAEFVARLAAARGQV